MERLAVVLFIVVMMAFLGAVMMITLIRANTGTEVPVVEDHPDKCGRYEVC